MQLNQARILLTGATGGLGRELARQLAAAGARLLVAGLDTPADEARLAELLGELGPGHEKVTGNLSTAAGIAEVAGAAQDFAADVLINNAGIGGFGLFEEQDWERIDAILATNLAAPMHLTHALLPHLKARPQAAIVNIGSMFGSLPFAGFVAYSAAKAALRAFSQGLRRELADTRVAVIHVAPRAIATPLNTPAVDALNRELKTAYDQPAQVAARIVAALRGGAGEHHIGFPEKLFAWINGIAPGIIDNGVAGKLAAIKRHATTR
jgi:short-subunit dehydrogenase